MVKVGIPPDPTIGIKVEWCWAKRLSASYARLDNVCLCQESIGFGDVVEFCEQAEPHAILKKFVRVVSRGSKQVVVTYATANEAFSCSKSKRAQLQKRRRKIDRFLENDSGGIAALAWAGGIPGVLYIALPVGTTEEEIAQFLSSCPHLVDPSWL